LLCEVVTFMNSIKYIAFDIVENHYIDGRLVQVDMLFCRIGSELSNVILVDKF
jgi:hypothetical protein